MATRALVCFGSVLLVLAAPSSAQDRDRLDRQVQEMRRQVVEGQVIRSHVRVTVRLKNGNRIRGIVKDGFLVERVDGLRFVGADQDDPGAGIRLYYWNGRRNFVFLPFADMREYHVNQRLSSDELAAIEYETRRQEEEEARRLAAERAAAGQQPGTGTPEGGAGSTDPAAGETPAEQPAVPLPGGAQPGENGIGAELQGLYQLLQQYPPSAGWGPEKRDEISRRKAVIGANPSPAELKFVERYREWEHACRLFGVTPGGEQPQGQEGGEPGGEEGGRRGRRR